MRYEYLFFVMLRIIDNHYIQNIASHASRYVNARHKIDAASKPPLNDPTLDLKPGALTESLKLLFNLTKLYPNHVHDFTRTITPILEILHNVHLETQPLQPPVSQLINALLNLNISDPANFTSHSTPFFTPPTPNAHISRLIQILDLAIRSSKEEQLESVVPLVTLLRRIYELAPARIEHEMQAQLLPSNEERAQPLGQSDTLASHLLHLTISPLAPNLKESVSCMLFELSSKDATTFVRNVGYGFAAGFLMTHNLPVPENTLEDPGAKLTSVDGQAINPITGQRRDMEPEDPLPEMTDEEKEREAERLFVLFERLKATGVVEVVNPVEAVVGEGRFKEVE